MTREIFLNLSERFVVAECAEEDVGISAIKSLPCGGTRLVCMSVGGAVTMRRKLRKNLMKDMTSRSSGTDPAGDLSLGTRAWPF
jgi:hypothetical protein